MSETTQSPYWYEGEPTRGRRVLEALRTYQAAAVDMRRRTRRAMSVGDNDMLVLRFIVRADREGRTVTPTDIARYLGISTAASTTLIDRLEHSGHLIRHPHPTDRRRIVVTHTAETDDQLRATLAEMHERMLAATLDLTDVEAEVIVTFLQRMQEAVAGEDEVGRP